MSVKNSNDSIGNQSRDLPACSAVISYVLVVMVVLLSFDSWGHIFDNWMYC